MSGRSGGRREGRAPGAAAGGRTARSPAGPGPGPPPVDLRAATLAAGVWAGCLAVLLPVSAGGAADGGAWTAAAAAGGPVLAAVAVAWALRAGVRRAPRAARAPERGGARAPAPRPARAVPAALLLAGVGAGACVAGLHVRALHADPLGALVGQRATASLEVEVRGDPVVLPGRSVGGRAAPDAVEVAARVRRVAARGQDLQVDVPVVLRLAADAADAADAAGALGRAGVAPGAVLAVDGRLAPPRAGADAAAVVAVRGRPRVLGPPRAPDAAATRLREGLARAAEGLPPDAAALVAGLAVGDESALPADLDDAMRASGLTHLTAVSGGNTAVVLAVVLAVARAAGLRTRGRTAVAVAALAGFVVLVRPQPSVLRAAAMGLVVLVGALTGSRRRGPPVLGAAVCGLLLAAPSLAVSWGFALSTAATAGLLLLAPRLLGAWLLLGPPGQPGAAVPAGSPGVRPCGPGPGRAPLLRRAAGAAGGAAAVTVAAQLATAPLVAALGGGIGLAAVPANLLAAPAVAPVTVLGMLAAVLSVPAAPAAAGAAVLAAPFALWIAAVARRCAGLPLAVLPWPSGAAGGLLLGAALLGGGVAGAALRRRWRRRPPHPAVVAATAAVLAGAVALAVLRPPGRAAWPPDGWVAVACDVGQGDALALRAGEGQAVVVDAGPDPDAARSCLDDLGVRRVPLLVLTHFHADHVAGLAGVLRGREVDRAVVSPLPDPADQAARVGAGLAAAGVEQRVAVPGTQGADGDVRWRVLWPWRAVRGESAPNDASVVLLVEVRGVRLLLAGDVEPAAQAVLMAGAAAPAADVVKVPHHGSAFQHPAFVGWSGARLALVSVGEGNDYGHPAEATLAAYRAAGALVARTDAAGDLAVVLGADGRLGVVGRRGPAGGP